MSKIIIEMNIFNFLELIIPRPLTWLSSQDDAIKGNDIGPAINVAVAPIPKGFSSESKACTIADGIGPGDQDPG